MAVYSPLSSRRSANRKAEATQQLIVFRLFGEGFALPIRAVQKVIPMGKIYGASQGAGVSLTLYQNQELMVIDLGHRIFKRSQSQDLLLSASEHGRTTGVEASDDNPDLSTQLPRPYAQEEQNEDSVQRYILIVQNSRGKIVGLPLDSPPSLQRVPESAFTPLTSDYITEGNIRCVSALIVQNDEEPPLFLLNPDQLIQPSHQALPSAYS